MPEPFLILLAGRLASSNLQIHHAVTPFIFGLIQRFIRGFQCPVNIGFSGIEQGNAE
jgi:hypothetical protein